MVWGALALVALGGRAEAQNQGSAPSTEQLQKQAKQLEQTTEQLQKQTQQLQKQIQQHQQAQAQAQGGGAPAGSRVSSTSDAFDRACVDLLHGKTPPGEQAIKTLRDACANLMSGKADARIQAEQKRQAQIAAASQPKQPTVQPGQSTAQPSAGEGVLAAFGQAATELQGNRKLPLGMRPKGPVGYLLVTNPIGYFNGLGVNAELWGALPDAPKFSWVGGVRYSGTDTSSGSAITFGLEGGFDWFIMGQHNEGLRLGPRAELAAGREHSDSTNTNSTFSRLGLGGEIGYNFIASNGITGLAAVGVGGRVAGSSKNENFQSFVGGEFGPYAKVGVGYAW
jgi:hypothetical protein